MISRVFIIVSLMVVCQSETPDISKQVTDTYNSLKDNARSKVDSTVDTIKNKSEKIGKNVSDSSKKLKDDISHSTIFSEISDFFKTVFTDIAAIFKSLFGNETPGQPALAASLSPETPSTSKWLYICALGALAMFLYKTQLTVTAKSTNENYQIMEESLL